MGEDGDDLATPLGTFSLVMPFVVVTSRGGPLDDAAFTAGWHCGEIDRRLATIAEAGGTAYATPVRSAVVAQLDLIAMRHGFKVTVVESGTSGWSYVTFTAGAVGDRGE